MWMKEKTMLESRTNLGGQDTHTIVCDMEGLGLHVADYEAMQCLRRGIEMEQRYFPGTIHHLCAQRRRTYCPIRIVET